MALLLVSAAGACAAPQAEEAIGGGSSKVTAKAFDRNAVIDDKSLGDATTLDVDAIQKLLDKTPWNKKSVLATYSENGKSAAQIMVEAAKKYDINPLELVTRAQMEQGLIYKTTAPASTIDKAFGCGCPDTSACADKYKGFANQAECAAGTLRRSMDRALTTGTVSGWKRSAAKQTQDGLTVTPKNAATAALYTYTPWVGEFGGGKQGVGGVSLHFQVWNQMAGHAQYGAWATQTETQSGEGDTDASTDPPTDPTDPPADEDPPTTDAGAADSAPRSDAGAGTDAGPPRDGPTNSDAGADVPAEDGSDDSEILGEGSTPPSSNSGPVTSKNKTPTKPEDLPTASDEELASKKKAGEGGCSTTSSPTNASNGLLVLAAAVALLGGRRRRA
ncbi:MAG: hypothetical protein JST00_12760 [Deltaproteobacteria bacterium]|nr:hypothetical protein [Deltaproteobacteria bacterium]